MDFIKDFITEHILTIVVSVIGIFAARYVSKLIKIIEQKFHIDIDDRAEQIIKDLIKKSIRVVYQTFVKQKKKDGDWNSVSKKEALMESLNIIQNDIRRSGLTDYIKDRNLIYEIESELVKEKNKNKKVL
uniref:Holin n=1 Tax=viral metagenome TaxID=1070528 RepID=A0A6M3JD25_9ZZZZ